MPQPVYKLSDSQDCPIEGQLYNYGLDKVTVSPQTEFQMDKTVRMLNKNGITHLVKWKR